MYSTLKRRGNDRFCVVSPWNTRRVFVGGSLHCRKNRETGDLVTLAEEILYGKRHFLPITIFARHRFLTGSWILLYLHCSSIPRSSRPDVFCKRVVFRNFAKFTGNHLYQGPFFNKVAGLRQYLKSDFQQDIFQKRTEFCYYFSFSSFCFLEQKPLDLVVLKGCE